MMQCSIKRRNKYIERMERGERERRLIEVRGDWLSESISWDKKMLCVWKHNKRRRRIEEREREREREKRE